MLLNVVANLPTSPTNEPQHASPTATSSALKMQKSEHTTGQKIQNYHRCPEELKRILYVITAGGAQKLSEHKLR